MQEKARAEVISILGNEPIIPSSDQLKVYSHYRSSLYSHKSTVFFTQKTIYILGIEIRQCNY